MILGTDLGNYLIKTSTGFNVESKISETKNILTTSSLIDYAGKQFVIGEGEFDSEYRKVKKENYLALLFAAMALSSNDSTNKIVVGLPISQYHNDKQELTNLILQNSHFEGYINGDKRVIDITDVEVYPEAVGTVPLEFEGIIVDIGGRTTDICQITHQNGRRKIENPFSEALGMINLYSDFIKALNNSYSLDLKLNDANRILSKGLKIKGISQDISQEKKVFKDYVNKIISKLQVEYSVDTLDVKLTGGGSLVLGNAIKKRLGANVSIVENSLFANADAFEKVGNEIWLRK